MVERININPLLSYMKKVEKRVLTGEEKAVEEPHLLEDTQAVATTRIGTRLLPQEYGSNLRHFLSQSSDKITDSHLEQLAKRTDKPLLFSVQNPTSEKCLIRFQAQKDLVMKVVRKLCDEHKTASVFPQINWFLGKPQEVFLFHNGAKLYYLDGGWWLIGGYSRDGSDALAAMIEFAKFV
jgi:hypothetical protein